MRETYIRVFPAMTWVDRFFETELSSCKLLNFWWKLWIQIQCEKVTLDIAPYDVDEACSCPSLRSVCLKPICDCALLRLCSETLFPKSFLKKNGWSKSAWRVRVRLRGLKMVSSEMEAATATPLLLSDDLGSCSHVHFRFLISRKRPCTTGPLVYCLSPTRLGSHFAYFIAKTALSL